MVIEIVFSRGGPPTSRIPQIIVFIRCWWNLVRMVSRVRFVCGKNTEVKRLTHDRERALQRQKSWSKTLILRFKIKGFWAGFLSLMCSFSAMSQSFHFGVFPTYKPYSGDHSDQISSTSYENSEMWDPRSWWIPPWEYNFNNHVQMVTWSPDSGYSW